MAVFDEAAGITPAQKTASEHCASAVEHSRVIVDGIKELNALLGEEDSAIEESTKERV